jgi:tetratricopeptide (TPR) repeat protein
MNDSPKESRINQIRRLWEIKETEYLLEIWEKHDTQEWTEEIFTVIREILLDRSVELPGHVNLPQVIYSSDASELISQAMQHLKKVDDYMDAGELDNALGECESAIKAAPNLGAAQYYRGLIYDEMGQLEKAIAAYQEAVRLDPELEDAFDALRNAETELEQTSQLPPAQQHLDQAVDNVYADDLKKALQECDLAIQTMPRFTRAHNYRGMILEEMGQLEDAITAYYEAVRIDSEFYAARENLCNAKIALEYMQYRQLSLENFGKTAEEEGYQLTEEGGIDFSLDELQEFGLVPNEDTNPTAPALYLDEKSFVLVGWPGHRTRPGRSGYDPLDTDFELAHMEGIMARLLFTGKFRTHNLAYLIGMTSVGILFCLALVAVFANTEMGVYGGLVNMIIWSPYWVIGISLLINVYLSLSTIINGIEDDQGNVIF